MLEIHLSQRFSNIAYFKARFEVHKIWLPFFSYRSPLLSTSILNDTNEIYGTAQLNLTLARVSLTGALLFLSELASRQQAHEHVSSNLMQSALVKHDKLLE